MDRNNTQQAFAPFADKMRGEGLPEVVIRNFAQAYAELAQGATGYIPGAIAQPVDDVPDFDELPLVVHEAGQDALARVVICKLNGGLGTSMGMQGPKSLLPVKQGLSFLDITVRQVLHIRAQTGSRLPLVLMNSFSTRDESLAALNAYPALKQDLPLDFLQNKVPKVDAHSLAPVAWPADPEKEWCPPGHGDIYTALVTNGLLAQMLAQGYEYLFVSNSDNLGATLDVRILGYFASAGLPFLMEVADRTRADSKGGHLARTPHGQLILRELAQAPPEELEAFQDIRRYRFFNTNNLWIHLPSLAALLEAHNNVLHLPLIRNRKPVEPTQPDSPPVYQLETAMGSAIALFAGAQALRVPRTRFAPVKKNSDLLALWSDAYALTPDFQVVLAGRDVPPTLHLDDRYYALIDDMRSRFPHGAPSLRACQSLTVEGDAHFGDNIIVRGNVMVEVDEGEVLHIPDGALLE